MRRSLIYSLIISLISFTLASCGGGGSAGIGGTGITSGGTITGFGSIFVNGVEYDTSTSTITINGSNANESDLKLGMFVLVRGTLDSNNTTGTASSISINIELKGPVSAAPSVDLNNNTVTFSVLGNTVIASADSTVFDGSGFLYNTIAMGDVVEIHGLLDSTDTIQATRIEKQGIVMPGITEVEVNGTLGNVQSAMSFVLATATSSIIVDHDGSIDFSSLPFGTALEVKGILTATNEITASEIEQKDSLLLNTDDEVEFEGIITEYIDDSNFKINGIQIDASTALKKPLTLSLANDIKIEVEGSFSNNVLIANEIETRSGEIKIQSVVSDVANNKISLSYASGQTIEVTINSISKLEDDTSSSSFAITDIMVGDYLEITGYVNDSEIIVVDLKREMLDTNDAAILKGDVSAIGGSVGAETIDILGVIYPTDSSTSFEIDDMSKTRTEFFAELANRLNFNGDSTVKIEDDWRVDSTVDGIADKLELD